MMFGKLCVAGALSLILTSSASEALAAPAEYEDVPSDWFIQDYIGSPAGVTLWRANLPNGDCVQSQTGSTYLAFPSTVTDQEVNRFWSSVLSAKATGTKVGIYYDNQTCIISSFFIPNIGG